MHYEKEGIWYFCKQVLIHRELYFFFFCILPTTTCFSVPSPLEACAQCCCAAVGVDGIIPAHWASASFYKQINQKQQHRMALISLSVSRKYQPESRCFLSCQKLALYWGLHSREESCYGSLFCRQKNKPGKKIFRFLYCQYNTGW